MVWELTKSEKNRIFNEACNGYGFEEVEQDIDGIYCTGCHRVHKRPTKMYSNGKEHLCKHQIVRLYNPEDGH